MRRKQNHAQPMGAYLGGWKNLTLSRYAMYTRFLFGCGQSEPYSCRCMPQKHTSTPSIFWKQKMALWWYTKDSG